jgi:hypothetical protein
VSATEGKTNDIVHLLFAAGANASRTLNTALKIDRDGRV